MFTTNLDPQTQQVASIPRIPVIINLRSRVRTDIFGVQITDITSRLDPAEAFSGGSYTIVGRLRNVQNVNVNPANFVDVIPPLDVTIRGTITPAVNGDRAFNPIQPFVGARNVFEVAPSSGGFARSSIAGVTLPITIPPQSIFL